MMIQFFLQNIMVNKVKFRKEIGRCAQVQLCFSNPFHYEGHLKSIIIQSIMWLEQLINNQVQLAKMGTYIRHTQIEHLLPTFSNVHVKQKYNYFHLLNYLIIIFMHLKVSPMQPKCERLSCFSRKVHIYARSMVISTIRQRTNRIESPSTRQTTIVVCLLNFGRSPASNDKF